MQPLHPISHSSSARSLSDRGYFVAVILVWATLLAYAPAWNGQPIMDDVQHLTTPEHRTLGGLGQLWIKPDTTQQYHPLVDTFFWVEDKLWGESMWGYHIANILLHGACALLLLKILQRLQVPGAFLAAAIFSLHPVQVESVAFLVELKNTLSGIFFFGALLAYLRFDERRDWRSYSLVVLLFFVGLFAKTTLALLPAAALIALWWKRGRLEWKRDVVPLIPFFLIGIVAGAATHWMEREFSGAKGEGFEFSAIERCLLAGRAFWFYLGKIFWPSNLMLIYSRWSIDPTVWWQYIFPAAALGSLILAWALRHRWRWMLAGLLFFTVMAVPTLGFFSLRMYNFQFVSDHFQYLPMIGIVTPIAAGAAILIGRWRGWQRAVGCGICVTLLAGLWTLTWRHSRMFRDSETCYRMVLEKNPNAWPAHFNLAIALLNKESLDEAAAHFEAVLRTNVRGGRKESPRLFDGQQRSHLHLGDMALRKGSLEEARSHFEESLRIKPSYAAHSSLGSIAHRQGRLGEATAHFEEALRIKPQSAVALNNLAWIFATASDPSFRNGPRAVELALRANELSGNKDPVFLHTLAAAYAETGQFPNAIATERRAFSSIGDRVKPGLIHDIEIATELYELGLSYRETRK